MSSAGCYQEMAVQPAPRPLEPSAFFADGQSARPLVAGTVARRRPGDDPRAATGLRDVPPGAGAAAGAAALAARDPVAAYVTAFPAPVTTATLERGRERYAIFCAACHGPTGLGDGKIVERGYTRPPSFVTDRSRGLAHRGVNLPLRDVPVGYYFEVITKGYGAMPDYAAQVPPADRWAIIAYVRALQLSQYARLADLPPDVQKAARAALEGRE